MKRVELRLLSLVLASCLVLTTGCAASNSSAKDEMRQKRGESAEASDSSEDDGPTKEEIDEALDGPAPAASDQEDAESSDEASEGESTGDDAPASQPAPAESKETTDDATESSDG